MKLMVLDKDRNAIAIVDQFDSLIWTERFWEPGDFELKIAATTENVSIFVEDYYLWLDESDNLMIIEDISITSDIEDGDSMVITGRDLLSVLDRRVTWEPIELSGNIYEACASLINQNFLQPSLADRKMENVAMRAPLDFEALEKITINRQVEAGEDCLDTITDMCRSVGVGFSSSEGGVHGQTIWQMVIGTDRSMSQEKFPWVIFSPEFGSLVNANFESTYSTRKNAALVVGPTKSDSSGNERTIYGNVTEGSKDEYTGWNRRETSISVSGVQTTRKQGDETVDIPDSEIVTQIDQKGYEELLKMGAKTVFDGETDPNCQFQYGKDYFMGDIVEVAGPWGLEFRTRVTEYIRSWDANGHSAYPAFTVVGQEGDD